MNRAPVAPAGIRGPAVGRRSERPGRRLLPRRDPRPAPPDGPPPLAPGRARLPPHAVRPDAARRRRRRAGRPGPSAPRKRSRPGHVPDHRSQTGPPVRARTCALTGDDRRDGTRRARRAGRTHGVPARAPQRVVTRGHIWSRAASDRHRPPLPEPRRWQEMGLGPSTIGRRFRRPRTATDEPIRPTSIFSAAWRRSSPSTSSRPTTRRWAPFRCWRPSPPASRRGPSGRSSSAASATWSAASTPSW